MGCMRDITLCEPFGSTRELIPTRQYNDKGSMDKAERPQEADTLMNYDTGEIDHFMRKPVVTLDGRSRSKKSSRTRQSPRQPKALE